MLTPQPPEILVCCGVGGTGKTTISAGLSAAAAMTGRRVALLTIDPARRLASALGLPDLNHTPTRVDLGTPGNGQLWAMMLDRERAWLDLVSRCSTDPSKAEQLLANRYFQGARSRLTGSHEYMALSRLVELSESQRYDLLVIDTPPARHVLDFFRAPARIERLFDRTILQGLSGGGLLGAATRRALVGLQAIAGDNTLQEIQGFLSLAAEVGSGLAARSAQAARLLRSDLTRYYLVADVRSPDRDDLQGFLDVLQTERMQVGGLILNRVARRWTGLLPSDEVLAQALRPLPDPASWHQALLELPARQQRRAARDRRTIDRLSQQYPVPLWLVPESPGGVTQAGGLRQLAAHLPPLAVPTGPP